jgi:uroporphyrinogen-III synthase
MNIILTRPFQDSLRVKDLLSEKSNNRFFIQPSIEIQFIEKPIEIPKHSFVIITSKNAALALNKNSNEKEINIVAVGEYSAKICKNLGYANVIVASSPEQSSNQDNLFNFIKTNIKPQTLFHVSADHVTEGLEKLSDFGFNYKLIELYKSIKVDFSDEFISKLKNNEFNAICFFSKRSTEIFIEQIKDLSLEIYISNLKCFCFSKKIALATENKFSEIILPEITNMSRFLDVISAYRID